MASVGNLIFDFIINRSGLNLELNKMKDDIKGFNKRIQDETALQFSLDTSILKSKLDWLKAQLKAAKKSGDYDLEIGLNSDIEIVWKQLTSARWQLRNYARTGAADVSVLWENFRAVTGAIDKQGNAVTSAINNMKTASLWLWKVLSGVLPALWAWVFIKTMFDLTSQVQQAKIAFTQLSGSAEQANKLFKDIQIFAAKTPFDQLWLVDGAKRLLAYGFQAKQVIPIMNSLGNAVSASWGWQEALNGVIVALWQMQTKGKLVQQELNQIAERWVPIFQILKDKLWLTQEQMWKVWEQGITAARAIPLILEWINERFGGIMDKQSKTLQGQLSNIIDILKINVSAVWEELAPIISGALSALKAIIQPIFAIIVLWLKGISAVAGFVFGTFQRIYRVFADNFIAITKLVTAAFLWWLVIMKRAVIIDFYEWVVKRMIAWFTAIQLLNNNTARSILLFITSLKASVIAVYQSTLAWIRDTAAKIANTTATKAQLLRNNLATLSFRALWISIAQTTLRLLLLASRFFIIGTIVAVVVALIYQNWEKLKNKLKPVFEFIASIGAAAPNFISKAWNAVVNTIASAIRFILDNTAKLAKAIESVTGVKVWGEQLESASKAVWSFADSLQLSESDVKSFFQSIKDGATGAFDAITWGINWWSLGAMTDLNSAFDELWDRAQKWGAKWKASMEEVQGGIQRAATASKDYKKELESIDKLTQKIKDKQEEYAEAVRSNATDNINKLRDLQREYDKTIAKVIETRDEELKNIEQRKNEDKTQNTQDFTKEQAQKFAESLQKVLELQRKLLSSSDQSEVQRDINEELQKQADIQANLQALRDNASDAAKTELDNIIKEAQYRASLTETQRELYDFKLKQKDLDDKAAEDAKKATQKAVDDTLKAQQELAAAKASIETQKQVIAELDKVKNITKSQVDSFLDSEKFRSFDEESQKLIEKLLDLRLSISQAKQERGLATKEAKQKEIELEKELAFLQEQNLWKLSSKYIELAKQAKELSDKNKEVFGSVEGRDNITKWDERRTSKVLGGLEKTQVVVEEESTQSQITLIKQKALESDALIEQQKRDQTTETKKQELDTHIQAVQSIQAVTQWWLIQMQNIRSTYYANITGQTSRAVTAMIGQYNLLANSLRQVIALQRQANSGWGAWFASWGFTGTGWKYEVAGVVHKWEYVVPQWMVNKYWGVINQLEGVRNRWFAEWWFTSTTNRSVNINWPINMRDGMDFDKAMDYRRRKI